MPSRSGRQNAGVDLHVVADDRTGAIETAAAIADRTGVPVPVAVWPDLTPPSARASVVDLATRHLEADEAAARAASLPDGVRSAHKIDSTLRGNWATELAARHATSGRPVVLVPALPTLGRVCVDGVVLADGVPVHESDVRTDPRRPPRSSRPAEHLAEVGVEAITVHDAAALNAWFRRPTGIAVVDAVDQRDIDAVVDRWHAAGTVVLAGTSAVVGAAIGRPLHHAPARIVQPPILVVCGSVHPGALRQIERARLRGAVVVERVDPDSLASMAQGVPLVLRTPPVDGSAGVGAGDAALARLVAEASSVVESGHVGTLVLIGGDTTAALLGDALVVVLGTVRPGTALVESLVVEVPVVTRAGGFGADDALVDLLWGSTR
jgi:uncharacterized protein YgbK (DUF1537 family)